MTPGEFKACCRVLGWRSRADVARALLADETRVGHITRWRTGQSPIPWWVTRDLRHALGIGPGDPWPSGLTVHEAVIPRFK